MSEATFPGLLVLLALAAVVIAIELLWPRPRRPVRTPHEVLMVCPQCDASDPYEASIMCRRTNEGPDSVGCPMVTSDGSWPREERS
jgi:hypothetical protein